MKARSDDEILRLGDAAARLLRDEAVQELLQDMRDSLLSRYESLPSNDVQPMVDINCQIRALRQLGQNLENYQSQAKRLRVQYENEQKGRK